MMSEWISIKDRLPNVDKTKGDYERVVVIATTGKTVKPLIYERARVRGKTVRRWRWMWDRIYDDQEITHWMPLPKPPKEGDEDVT